VKGRRADSTKSKKAPGMLARGIVGVVVAMWCACAPPPETTFRQRPTIGIVRSGDDVRLTGLEPIRGWGEQRDNSFMHVAELVLNALGYDVNYDELMGLSGMAFRAQMRVGVWDAGVADPLVGADCVEPLMAALGLEYETFFPRPDNLADVGRSRNAIVASLDFGVPVLATNLIPPENWGIITGYRYKGQAWWCRTYTPAARRVDQIATGWPTAVVVMTPGRSRPDPVALRRASLGRAIQLQERRLVGDYAVGQHAFDTWCEMLEQVSDRRYMQPNAWMYVSLIDARGAAVRYLRRIAESMGPSKRNVLEAAEAYARGRQALVGAVEYVPWPNQLAVGVPSLRTRQRQIEALKQAAALEAEAIEALRRVR
jgi:hypothetical protein